MSIVVVRRIPSGRIEGNADGLHATGRQQSWVRYGECAGHHRGLRAGHASTGVTRELGRAICLLAYNPGLGDRVTKSPGVVGGFHPATSPYRDTTNARKQARYREASDKRSDPRGVGWQS